MDELLEWIKAISENPDDNELYPEPSEELSDILAPLLNKLTDGKTRLKELQTKLEQTEKELRFYQEVIKALPNPIFIKDQNACFVFFNSKYKKVFGMDEEQYLGRSVHDMTYLPVGDREKYHQEDLKMIETCSTAHYDKSFVFTDGYEYDTLYWSSGFAVPETGQHGLIGEIVDISKEKRLEHELVSNVKKLRQMNRTIEKSALMDPPTGLYNRRILENIVPDLIGDCHKRNIPISMLIADLDHFKQVNDAYGHMEGDTILADFAQELKNSCREGDMAIRYGGEEFLLILPGVDRSTAGRIARRICDKTREVLRLSDNRCVTVSIGVAQCRRDDDLASCIKRADQALYEAKKAGRDRVVER